MKIKKFFYIFIFLSAFFYCVNTVSAKIWLNEIYPAPQSPEKEWIELYNDEDKEINLSGYSLIDEPPANNKITLETTLIPPHGFIITSSYNVLNNTGDTVILKDNLGEIIETATYSGTFTSDKTFAKCPDDTGSWYALTTITKNSSNETACLVLTPTITLTPSPTTELPTPTLQPIPTPSYTSEVLEVTPTVQTPTLTNQPLTYDNIYISEVMVNPESGQKEWVELFNDNDFSISIDNWYIDDLENAGAAPKIFSLNINGKSYEVHQLTSSVFNNDGDHVRLLDFNKNLKDSFEYSKSLQGKTWGRADFNNDNFCLQEPSKSLVNNPCINPTPVPTSIVEPTKKQLLVDKKPTISYKQRIINNLPAKPEQVSSLRWQAGHQSSTNNPPQVLGINTSNQPSSPSTNTVKGFSLISFSYSLLTIASVLIKMKFNG